MSARAVKAAMTHIRYEQVPIVECGEPLVNLAGYPFLLEPVYFHKRLSNSPDLFVRESVALKLVRVQQATGLRVKVFDPWRPRAVQEAIYRAYWAELEAAHPDWDGERLAHEVGVFVTLPDDPGRIPPHATGGAVDMTLADADGVDLDMGTGFDHFGPESAPFHFDADSAPGRNRKILREAMMAEGFRVDAEEWWHFDYGNQLWAVELGKEHAVYGEVGGPVGV